MQKELIECIKENELSPFSLYKSPVKKISESFFKTRDAKAVHTKVLNKIAGNFCFPETVNLLSCFSFTQNFEEIKKR